MVGLNIYNNDFILIALERFYYSLPLWRRIISRLPIEKYKIQKEEFEKWYFKLNNL